MHRINEAREKSKLPYVKPCEVFDLIGGTSTGGIIAIMLGRLEMDVDECIAVYLELIKKLFEKKKAFAINHQGKLKNRFSSQILQESINEVLRNKGFSETEIFNDKTERKCKVFVVCKDKDTNSTIRLRGYTPSRNPDLLQLPTITQAAMATSAAVSFYEPVEISGRTFLDGGLGSNNPVDEVEMEARQIWRLESLAKLQDCTDCFLSIGTGDPGIQSVSDKAIKFLFEVLGNMATETETTANKSQNRWEQQVREKRYFRFNVDQGLGKVGLEEYKSSGLIYSATDRYLQDKVSMQDMLDQCMEALLAKQFGSGKTFITTSVIEDLVLDNFVGHFFYRYDDATKLAATDVFRAYITQIIAYMDIQGFDCPADILTPIIRLFSPKARLPDFDEVFELCFRPLQQLLETKSVKSFYIIDGLHECDQSQWAIVLRSLQKLTARGKARVLISGRELLNVTASVRKCITVTITKLDTKKDIRNFIDWKVANADYGRLTSDTELEQEIISTLNGKAHLIKVSSGGSHWNICLLT
ncbi:hypothetical protein E8E13_005657 [Curvularia kusanoi]|uniref:PNPLA domain-containing protein n=1 Tax=Curvularia kusanoi TaxID=90978 RepID=A0A9P4T9I3_CURKU|nr:hypothetical protein E8E13_005657 [Curvularia kusanoi]